MAAINYEEKAKSLGKAIKGVREERQLTQAELGDLVGLSRPAIAAFETGRVTPSLELVDVIARALSLHPRALVNTYLDPNADSLTQSDDKTLRRVIAKVQSMPKPQLENTSRLLDLVILRDGLPRDVRRPRETARRKERVS